MTELERQEMLKVLNQILGKQYRSIPYCLSDSENFGEFLMQLSSTCMDYCYYQKRIMQAEDCLYFAVKTSNPKQWIRIEEEVDKESLEAQAFQCIYDTAQSIESVVNRAKDNLRMAVTFLLKAPDSFRQAILEQTYNCDLSTVKKTVNKVIDGVDDLVNIYSAEGNYKVFLEYLKNCLSGKDTQKETKEQIEIRLGFKPQQEYDLNNIEDLKKLLTIRLGKYLAYSHVSEEIDDVASLYDQALEDADPLAWFKIESENAEDVYSQRLYSDLEHISATLDKLKEAAAMELVELLEYLLSCTEGIRYAVLGKCDQNPIDKKSLCQLVDNISYDLGSSGDWDLDLSNFLDILATN